MAEAAEVVFHPSVHECIRQAAGTIWRRYRRWVEREDVEMELWAWVYGHPDKTNDLAEHESWLLRRLRTVAERFARKEKAQRSGYHPDDEVWYSQWHVVELLPDALNPAATPPQSPMDELAVTGGGGGKYSDWEASMADLRGALAKMCSTDVAALRRLVADRGTINEPATRAALWTLQRLLGGPHPGPA